MLRAAVEEASRGRCSVTRKDRGSPVSNRRTPRSVSRTEEAIRFACYDPAIRDRAPKRDRCGADGTIGSRSLVPSS